MSDYILKEIDFEYYNRLFIKTAGESYGLAMCTREGEPLWVSAGLAKKMVREALTVFQNKNNLATTEEETEDKHISLNGKGILLCHLIHSSNNGPIGWLAALSKDPGNKGNDECSKMVIEALRDLSPGILREYELNSELNSMTKELSERYEELNLIYNMGNLSKKHERGHEIFIQMVKLCTIYMGADMVFFIRPEKKQVFHTINSNNKEIDINFLVERIRDKIYSFVAYSKKSIVFNEDANQKFDLRLNALPYKVLAAPIFLKKKVIAVLAIFKGDNKTNFTNSDRNLLEVMANQAGIIIQNRHLYSEQQLFIEQMVTALIESIDAKDPYTRGHSDRVNSFSIAIGEAMGLSEHSLKTLYWASHLHDLGKIGVPDVILTKKGKLTDEEFTVIKMHPDRGYNILKDIKYLKESLPGIRHHHERYDGTGYPQGLKGKEIPLHARIIAVADTYDAMTSTRSYRAARSQEETIEEIKRVAGTQLDKRVVQTWIQIINDSMPAAKAIG